MAGMFRELRADEIECRISRIVETERGPQGVLLLYKDARTDAKVLDETVGCENWQNKYYEVKGNLFCSVGLRINNEWIWKDDCGTESNTEKQKGEASDAFKRACFRFGLGRELYTAPQIWVDGGDCKTLKQDKYGNWKCYDRFKVRVITYDGGSIKDLAIENAKTNVVVFSKGTFK